MNIRIQRNSLVVATLVLMLGACGGGDENPPVTPPAPPPPPPGTVIGAAGGTVTGPNGAQVVIPAGALVSEVRIHIAQIAAGAQALPAGFSSQGQMFAFTPHGTTFAVPVTMTLPFDPATVPGGRAPAFYKTNAQGQWEQITNATFGATSVSAQVTGFSDATVVIPPLSGLPIRLWSFKEYRGDALLEAEVDGGTLIGGAMEARHDFGQAYFDPYFRTSDGNLIASRDVAMGVIASSTDGVTHFVGTAAQLGNAGIATDPIGSRAQLLQYQTFVKNAADASLTFTIGSAFLETFDGNGVLGRHCPDVHISPVANELPISRSCDLIKAEIYLDVQAYTATANGPPTIFFRTSGGATVNGSAIGETVPLPPFPAPVQPTGSWDTGTWTSSQTALWTTEDFDFIDEYFNGLSGHIEMSLSRPLTYTVNLSSIGIGQAFTLRVDTHAYAYNRAARAVSGQGAEFATAANAWMRDPVSTGGTTVTINGLTLVDTPMPLAEPVEAPVAPAACVPGPAPDPTAGLLQFSAASYMTTESRAAPVVTVTRTGGSNGAVTATFTTSDGTAVAGVDYTAVRSTVFFANGDDVPRAVPVPIVQDQIAAEPDRTVNLALSQPGGCAALGTPTTATLTIRDDDVRPLPTLFTVGGAVVGLTGVGLVLENHRGLFLEIEDNGPFTFSSLPSPTGTAYSVRVFNQPRNVLGFQTQACSVSNGTGVFANANVNNVLVNCVDL